jgi:hypothetical protein
VRHHDRRRRAACAVGRVEPAAQRGAVGVELDVFSHGSLLEARTARVFARRARCCAAWDERAVWWLPAGRTGWQALGVSDHVEDRPSRAAGRSLVWRCDRRSGRGARQPRRAPTRQEGLLVQRSELVAELLLVLDGTSGHGHALTTLRAGAYVAGERVTASTKADNLGHLDRSLGRGGVAGPPARKLRPGAAGWCVLAGLAAIVEPGLVIARA